MIHIVLCDDSPKDIERLSNIVQQYYAGEPVTIHTFVSSIEMITYLEQGGICQIAFLDIVMPGFNGIELARALRNARYKGYLIFVTSSNDFATESYEVSAFSYLLKPANTNTVFSLLDKVAKDMQHNDTATLLIKTKKSTQTLLLREILYVESSAHYLIFHTAESELTVYAGFQQYEADLISDPRFIRCHRTFIVNMDYIHSVQKQSFMMPGEVTIPISKSLAHVKQHYIRYIMEKEGANSNDIS